MVDRKELVRDAQAYCLRNGLVLGSQLGFGVHGIVFTTHIEIPTFPRVLPAAVPSYNVGGRQPTRTSARRQERDP